VSIGTVCRFFFSTCFHRMLLYGPLFFSSTVPPNLSVDVFCPTLQHFPNLYASLVVLHFGDYRLPYLSRPVIKLNRPRGLHASRNLNAVFFSFSPPGMNLSPEHKKSEKYSLTFSHPPPTPFIHFSRSSLMSPTFPFDRIFDLSESTFLTFF